MSISMQWSRKKQIHRATPWQHITKIVPAKWTLMKHIQSGNYIPRQSPEKYVRGTKPHFRIQTRARVIITLSPFLYPRQVFFTRKIVETEWPRRVLDASPNMVNSIAGDRYSLGHRHISPYVTFREIRRTVCAEYNM